MNAFIGFDFIKKIYEFWLNRCCYSFETKFDKIKEK